MLPVEQASFTIGKAGLKSIVSLEMRQSRFAFGIPETDGIGPENFAVL